MMHKKLPILYILLILLSIILVSFVNAEVLYGSLSSHQHLQNYSVTAAAAVSGDTNYKMLRVVNIENTEGLSAYIHHDETGILTTYSNSTQYSNSIPCDFKIAGVLVGSGTAGYQRLFNAGGTEIEGYQYLLFNSWVVTGYTGNFIVDIVYDDAKFNQVRTIGFRGAMVGTLTGHMGYYDSGGFISGLETFNYDYSTLVNWIAEKPAGLRIMGSAAKESNTRIIIVNGSDNVFIAGEGVVNPNNYDFNIFAETIKICAQSSTGGWTNTSVLFTFQEQYTLNVSPISINYGNNFNIKLESVNGTYNDIQEVRYGYIKSTGEIDILRDNINQNNWADYLLIAGTWFQFDTATNAYSINKGVSFPNPITIFGDTRGNIEVGDYIIKGYIFKTDNLMQEVTAPLSITQLNNQKLTVEVKDYLTGDLLVGSRINILDISKNVWNNISTASGSYIFDYVYGTPLYIEVTKTGYITGTKNWTVTSVPYYRLWMVLNRGITPPIDRTILYISIYDDYNLAPITGSLVTIARFNDLVNINVQYTLDSGMVTFNVSADDKFVISASKNGYQNGGTTLNTTGYGGSSLSAIIQLVRTSSVTPIPTITAPPTIITTMPTIQPLGANITPSICKITLPVNATILDVIKNQIACMGITTGTNQGYIFAIGIIFIFVIAGGRYGKGLGVLVGASAGFVISVAMELIPFWVFIAMVVISGLVISLKIWQSG